MKRFWEKVDKRGPDECWMWTAAIHGKGYGSFRFKGPTRRAHRVAYEISNGSIPDGLHVLHMCDNRRCVNPAHLFLGTHADNMRDRNTKGRQASGMDFPHCRLSDRDLDEVRVMLADGASRRSVAMHFGVHHSTIQRRLR